MGWQLFKKSCHRNEYTNESFGKEVKLKNYAAQWRHSKQMAGVGDKTCR